MSGNNGNTGIAERFKQALQQSEQTRDASHVASLFAEGAELTNLGGDHGNDAGQFWRVYLEQFSDIRSEFTSEIVSDSGAALEWVSRGTTAQGEPVDYRGVSIIDFNGDKLAGFRTYYDSAAFVGSKATTNA
jgi:ketosteroid isomerase-like protein